jgi:hypothetical protein
VEVSTVKSESTEARSWPLVGFMVWAMPLLERMAELGKLSAE